MTRWPPPVGIAGAGAVTAAGLDWREIGRAAQAKSLHAAPLAPLGPDGPTRPGFAAPPIPPDLDVDPGARRRMSPAARLAAVAARLAARDAGWDDDSREGAGFFLGVGASGADTAELEALLRASTPGGDLSLAALGEVGLRACNPLFTFQLMNNFTLCHAAIREGTRGPNAAFFSRGAGTVHAIAEAAWALAEGACRNALAGGADSALHPITWAEGAREGWLDEVHPAEGAALLALVPAEVTPAPLAVLERVAAERTLDRALEALADARQPVGAVVIAAARAGDRDALEEAARGALGAAYSPDGAQIVRLHQHGGESLAATPAVAAVAALGLLVGGTAARAAALTIGPDGAAGAVVLRRAA